MDDTKTTPLRNCGESIKMTDTFQHAYIKAHKNMHIMVTDDKYVD